MHQVEEPGDPRFLFYRGGRPTSVKQLKYLVISPSEYIGGPAVTDE